jgi:hypothetical protein
MGDLEKTSREKLIKIASDIEFENDFGQTPIGLGHITKNQSIIIVFSLVGLFVGTAIAGVPLAVVVLVAGLNDILSINKLGKGQETEVSETTETTEASEPEAIDVEAEAVETNEPSEPKQLEPVASPPDPPASPAAVQEPTISESVASKERSADRPTAKNQQPVTNNSPLAPEQWASDLMGYPSILIYGPQGAGKTSTAAWLIGERIKIGHQIKILDPHRCYGQWDGLECIGDGMDYEAINDELKAFTDEIKARYKARARIPNFDPPKLTLVCDEFTQWAKKCGHSATFFEESLTDIRKINLHVLFISHARTLNGLGGSSGLAAARDAGLLELELEAQVDPQTKKASPKLLGWLKYPGVAMNERQRVAIASWMNGSMDKSGSGVASTVIQQPSTVVEPVAERQAEQEAIASPEPVLQLKVSDSLGEPLKTIWLFAKKKGDWVTVRNVYDQKFKVLEGKKVEQIHQYLGLLADSGLGEVDEDGKSHSSVGFRAY